MSVPFPPLEPQHPPHARKHETKLRSDPQQSRNKGATEAVPSEIQQQGQYLI
jgi:hypothetical protein